MRITILGLSITSSWGNGHATNYRALVRALHRRGDEVMFLERDRSWYARHRDMSELPWCRTYLYRSLPDLRARFAADIREADLVMIGSFVPDGVEVTRWVLGQAEAPVVFYDIDTPVTLEKLRRGDTEYLSPELLSRFELYLSFTAGPALDSLRDEFGVSRARAFYCFVDPDSYASITVAKRWLIGYLGTYSGGRQPALEELLVRPARRCPEGRFVVAGSMYPPEIEWPSNVERIEHLPPGEHPRFYCSSEFALNVTRPEMREVGYSPSVRLFEAASCGVPIISDAWPGIDTILEPGREIFLADSAEEVLQIVRETDPERRQAVAGAARSRVLREHTADRRVEQLHELTRELQPGALR